jgi:hypothetical protein
VQVSQKWDFEKGFSEQLGMEYLILRSKMMKKLLVLMLVMGVASTANATYSLVSSAGDTLDPTGAMYPNITVIGIYNDTAGAGQGFMTIVTVPGDAASQALGGWTGNATINEPPSVAGAGENTYLGVIDPGTGVGEVDAWLSNMAAVPTLDPWGTGILAGYELICRDLGDVTVTLLADDFETVIDTMTIRQIPEPITFGLLGLGGLFLRRRK